MIRQRDVVIGGHYTAKVSGKIVVVKIVDTSVFGGWNAENVSTGRRVRVRSAGRLREKVQPDGRPIGASPRGSWTCGACGATGNAEEKCTRCGATLHGPRRLIEKAT